MYKQPGLVLVPLNYLYYGYEQNNTLSLFSIALLKNKVHSHAPHGVDRAHYDQ